MPLSTSAILDWNVAHDDFIPYNSIFTRINVPSSSPNYGPANVQIFSLKSVVRYAFCISQANISRPFNAEIFKAILTESLNTTDENVIEEVAVVMCPPPNSREFILQLLPSLISNIIWHLICWYPGSTSFF